MPWFHNNLSSASQDRTYGHGLEKEAMARSLGCTGHTRFGFVNQGILLGSYPTATRYPRSLADQQPACFREKVDMLRNRKQIREW